MNQNQPEAFGMGPQGGFPPIINPGWNPNNWNQQQAIRNLENRVTRLERETRRLQNQVARLEQNQITPFREETYQTDSYNMM